MGTKITKTIENCDPVEMLSQSYKIIDAVSDLFKKAKINELRSRMPKFTGDENEEEKKAKAIKQAKKNMSGIVAGLLRDHPEDTAKVLGLMCFIEPEDLKKYTGVELLMPAIKILTNEDILNFLFSAAASIKGLSKVIF